MLLGLGFIITDNEEKTLVVYEGSHKLHESYFREKNYLIIKIGI